MYDSQIGWLKSSVCSIIINDFDTTKSLMKRHGLLEMITPRINVFYKGWKIIRT